MPEVIFFFTFSINKSEDIHFAELIKLVDRKSERKSLRGSLYKIQENYQANSTPETFINHEFKYCAAHIKQMNLGKGIVWYSVIMY